MGACFSRNILMLIMKPTVVGGKLKLKGSAPSSAVRKPATTPAAVPVAASTVEKKDSSGDKNSSESSRKRSLEDNEAVPSSSTGSDTTSIPPGMANMTEAQRRFKLKQMEREKEEAKRMKEKSYRERVNEFNEKLSKLTEHNDIPRVSAAGNG